MTTTPRRKPTPPGGDPRLGHPATTLTVWHYDSAMGASTGEVRLRTLEERGALTVIDAITVQWMPDAARPRVGHVHPPAGSGARRGAVLGAVAGVLVLAPLAGAAAGAGVGALAGRLHPAGIDDAFLAEMTKRLTPGTSALLVLSENADLDVLRPFFERGPKRGDATLMHAVLRDDAPDRLRALLSEVPSLLPEPPVSGEPNTSGPALPSQPHAPSGRPRPRKESP